MQGPSIPAVPGSPASMSKSKGFLELIDAVDNVPLLFDFSAPPYYRLLLFSDPHPHGFIHSSTVTAMPWSASPAFVINHEARTVKLLDLSSSTSPKSTTETATACTAAFQAVIDAAIDADKFPQLHKQHSEHAVIASTKGATNESSTVTIERFPAPLFGVLSQGAHMTAYTYVPSATDPSKTEMKLWIARRSKHLYSWPDVLDTTVAGGIKAGDSPFECIVEEADEEASLPVDFVRENAKGVGFVSYIHENKTNHTIQSTILHNFDIDLPANVVPKPNDGEVSEFRLMSISEVKAAMLAQEFKSNCNLVMLDFFARHGIITPADTPDFDQIVGRLKRELPVPVPEDLVSKA